MQTDSCMAKCKMYRADGVRYLEAFSWAEPKDAELFVLTDEPAKRDIRHGKYLSEHAEGMLEAVVGNYVSFDKIHVQSAVRCFAGRKKAKSPEAALCFKQYAKPALDAYTAKQNKTPVLLMGFWPVKQVTGRDLKELHGKVMEIDGVRYGCVNSINYYIARHVRWWKDEDGRWQSTPGGFDAAMADWRREAMPVVDRMFGERHAHIDTSETPSFPFTRVRSPEEMCNILAERKGKYAMGDIESKATPYALERGWSALDWFYGPEVFDVTSIGFSFFDNYAETTYMPGKRVLTYDPDKVCVYTGDMGREALGKICRAWAETKILTFNGTYDTGALLVKTGVPLTMYADVCDMGYAVNQSRKKYNLESLIYEYVPEFALWAGEIKQKGLHASIPLPQLWHYNAGDVVNQHILFFIFADLLHKNNSSRMYWNILAPVKTYLRDMEAHGVMRDREKIAEIEEFLKQELAECEELFSKFMPCRNVAARAGEKFNPNSRDMLLDVLNTIHPGQFKDTQKGTINSFVDKLTKPCPFLSTLLRYRAAAKAYGTYIQGFAQRCKGSIQYTSFKINTTETGRTSSGGGDVVGLGKTNQVNIQNISRGGGLRKMFRARPNHYLAYGDYAQIEVRVAGAYARSPEIRDVCLSGLDFHGSMAAKAFRRTLEEIMEEDARIAKEDAGGTSMRTASKTITFGILYGMTARAVALKLKLFTPTGELDEALAQKFIDEYFAGMPSIKEFIDTTHAKAERELRVQTVFGRIRRFDAWTNKTRRESVNTLVQSAATDIFLLATTSICRRLQREGLYLNGVYPWAEVHDSLTFEVHESIPFEQVREIFEYEMKTGVRKMFPEVDAFMGEIPLGVDFDKIYSWK